METSCRICLAESLLFKKFYEKNDLISYSEMLSTLVADIVIQDEDILCATCALDLETSYNFVVKVQKNNKIFLEQSCECKLENVKDPLEESSCDEFVEKEEDVADANSISNENDVFKENPNLADIDFEEGSSASEKSNDELLLNNLSDLSVSPENLIFPRGRFNCHICSKSYFTPVGLKAHHEVHLPKTPATKKKRLRRQNKKKISKETTDLEQNDLIDVSQDLSENVKNSLLAPTDQVHTKPKPPKEKQLKPKKTFPCQVCGKEMISASKLRYHLVMHTGEKDFLCSMCPKAYSTIYALKHHFRSHSGYRPYECQFCGDRFYRPTTLKSHVRRHTGERPYGCETCGKRFIQHSSMTTHIKLNHMSKTIQCPHCDKKYARQTDLNTHLLSHTGHKPFFCQLCPSRFVRQANLNKHMKQQHFANSNEKKTEAENPNSNEENNKSNVQLIDDQILPLNESN